MVCVSWSSGSGTQMKAALFRYFARWRSTQLYEAFNRPPTNHFQKGALLVSRVVCQYLSQVSRSAYSLKHSGNLSSLNRSKMLGSLALAWPMNFAGGTKYSSSRQWTAISASETSTSCAAFMTSSVWIVIASYSLLQGESMQRYGRRRAPFSTQITRPTGNTGRPAIDVMTSAAEVYQATSAVRSPM